MAMPSWELLRPELRKAAAECAARAVLVHHRLNGGTDAQWDELSIGLKVQMVDDADKALSAGYERIRYALMGE